MNPKLKTITKKSAPIYLFKRLGRYIGVSTATGDFYNLTQETYSALEQWSDLMSEVESPFAEKAVELARKYSIPRDIIMLFPLHEKEAVLESEKNISSSITDLTLNLTSRCNLRCAYCWNDHGKYSNTLFKKNRDAKLSQKTKSRDMQPETARRAVDILVKLCGSDKNLVVDFYGGEPLINLDTLFSTIDYCRKNKPAWGVNFHFLLATNGTLLTPSTAKRLVDKGVQIAVSIDGPKEIQDKNRPFADGMGSFDAVASNLNNMPDGILKRLVGRTTVTPSYPDMVSLYKNLRNLGFERNELFESEDACHGINPQREAIFFQTEEQYQSLYKEYERLALFYIDEVIKGNLDYNKTFFNRFFKLMQRLYYNHEVSGGCPAAQGQLAVSANGDIYPCTAFLGVERFKFGNVMNKLDAVKYKSFITDIGKRFWHCRECSLFSLCRTTGSCLNVNYYFNGDMSMPYEKSCKLFREKLELAIASLAILSEKIPDRLEDLFGFDAVGKRGNRLY